MIDASDQVLKPVSDYAADLIDEQKRRDVRFLLGLVGAPAAGKSTFAADLVSKINEVTKSEIAIVVPMDGFHYSNEVLSKRNLLPLKGIPATFDAQGFVDLIRAIKTTSGKSVYCPLFDRSIEASIQDAIEIKPQHKIIVAEGNYLLLEESPWNDLREQFDQIWYIDANLETLMPRLIARHKAGGKTESESMIKIESTDLPNAKLIEATKKRADKRIKLY